MISDVQMIAVGVSQSPGIGRKTLVQLIASVQERGISLSDLWQANKSDLQFLGLTERVATDFITHREKFDLEKKRKDFESKSIQIVTILDEIYPELLKQIPDYPPVLYLIGQLKSKFSLPIAVVGTRKITSYGKTVTRMLTKELVQSGAQIISGFMYGVDACSHEAAIEFGGYTLGVLGYGFDHSYPDNEKTRTLRNSILEKGGGFISEYDPSTEPNQGFFPERNRIVAGLSKGVLVTEAAAKSGSKITAGLATEYGRDVFAVPGSITSPYSEGTKELVNQGAKLVTSANDILEEYQQIVTKEDGSVDEVSLLSALENDVEKKIVALLMHQSLDSDEIAKELELKSNIILNELSMLEIKGVLGSDRGRYILRL